MSTPSGKQWSSQTSSLQGWGPDSDAGLQGRRLERRLSGSDLTTSPVHPSRSLEVLNCPTPAPLLGQARAT